MNVIVVGGGPVGRYASIAARSVGMEVTVIEPRDGALDKACGEGLMPAALGALHDLGIDPIGVDFRGIRYLDAAGRRQVHALLPDGPGRGVRRTTLMTALLDASARAGVTSVSDRVTGIEQDAGGVLVRLASGGVATADAVLGCDGLGSVIRRGIGLDRAAPGPVRYGLRQHFAAEPWSDDVEVYWARHSEAYVTPVAQNLVGVALLGGRGETFHDRMRAFPGLSERLGGATPVGHTLGAGPLSRRASRPLRGRVLLVGDAAGYVDALTGEGLAIGFLSARAAVSALQSDDTAHYAAEWRQITRRFRWSTEALLRTTQRNGPRSALLPLASAAPAVFARAVRTMT